MSMVGWLFGHVFSWWMAFGTVGIGTLIMVELQFCRQRGRRQLPLLGRVGLSHGSARAAARSAADLRRTLKARELTVPHHLLRDTTAWQVVTRRQHVEQGWTLGLAVPPTLLSLVALWKLGFGWLVVAGAFLPTFSLLGLCIVLLLLDSRAVERGQSDERLRAAVLRVLTVSVERFGSKDRRGQFRLAEALRALDVALADHARYGVSPDPGDQQALLGQAKAMSLELHARFRATADRDPASLRAFVAAVTGLLAAVQEQRYLALVDAEKGRAQEPEVVAEAGFGWRTAATAAAFGLAVAAVYLAEWAGISGEGMALIAAPVIAVSQVPHLLLLRAGRRSAIGATAVPQAEVPSPRGVVEVGRPERR
ncbi:hypothetical protein OHV05_25265 [Kitasatospora sp. NBC_00070]|uniref:hypothetical protein n=1 Tax=Kitasatospora sp. NBC_00070 TaxID=2975962 RepID=UPI003245EF4F